MVQLFSIFQSDAAEGMNISTSVMWRKIEISNGCMHKFKVQSLY